MLIHSQLHLREQHTRELSRNSLPELEAHQVNNIFPYYTTILCISHAYTWNSLSYLLDGDLFDEAMDGGHINGRGEGSPEPFDLSHLGESLGVPSPRTCRTPEAFLGPAAASLVNLENLIPANSSAKTTNPFLSGINCVVDTMKQQKSRGTNTATLDLNQLF